MNPITFRWEAMDTEAKPEQGVLWAGDRSYPARFHRHSMHEDIPDSSDFLAKHPDYRMETRQCWVHFENQWQLSVIWGDATYSSNSMWFTPHDREQRPFIEEPTTVEVGVLMPEAGLWGVPLGYVSVPEFRRVAELVMHLPVEIDVPKGEWEDAEGFCDFLITAGLDRTL